MSNNKMKRKIPTIEDLMKLGNYKVRSLNPSPIKVRLLNARTDTWYDSSGYDYPTTAVGFRNVKTSKRVRLLQMSIKDSFEGRGAFAPWGEPIQLRKPPAIDFGYYINSKGMLFRRLQGRLIEGTKIRDANKVTPSSYNSMRNYCLANNRYCSKVMKTLGELRKYNRKSKKIK